jgi:octaprenyl-diphosphate synthase
VRTYNRRMTDLAAPTSSVVTVLRLASTTGGRLQDALAPITADMLLVDRAIRARLDSDVALVNTIAEYIVTAGGKRLRPAVLMLLARALDYRGEKHVDLAAVIEFIHTATLLHDDVVDESDLRRGRSTANSLFGNAASVLVGDFLYSRSFQMMVEAGSERVMRIMADATNRIAEGEVLQLLNIHDPSVNEGRYFEVVERKTATLFEAGARIAAVIAGADDAVEDRCANYGASLGKAFQIIDDVLDYSGDSEEIGKRLGDDLREGKMTLPLIHALRCAAPAQRDFVTAAVREGRGDCTTIARIVTENGSLDYSRALAEQEASNARTSLQEVPRTIFKDSLLHLTEFAIDRNR